jgi:hypothetical protein
MKNIVILCYLFVVGYAWISKPSRLARLDSSINTQSSGYAQISPSSASQNAIARSTGRISQSIFGTILLFLLSVSSADASALNPQIISLNGPFFQGWLIRSTDHAQATSFITIIGSFSKSASKIYSEHYVFCGIQHASESFQVEAFPSPDDVTITGSSPSTSSIFQSIKASNITWSAKDLGHFCITEEGCEINFNIHGCKILSRSLKPKTWKIGKVKMDGPEGWLGYTPLLPCHYHIHSTGSECQYTIDYPGKLSITGRGFSHIEGNHGSFFPDGWVWVQAVSSENDISLSVVGGLFQIGPISPMNFVIYLRHRDQVHVFRTTDAHRILYDIEYAKGSVLIEATSLSGSDRLVLEVYSSNREMKDFGEAIYIPTAKGFSNRPGCRETYTATAKAKIYNWNRRKSSYDIVDELCLDQVALEFGGSFQRGSYKSSRKPIKLLVESATPDIH